MSIAKTNILVLIAFFPIFALKSNLSLYEIIISFFIFLIPFLILNYNLVKKKILNNFTFKIYIALLIAIGIDNSLGLWNGLIQPFRYILLDLFKIIYYPAFFFLFVLIIIFYIILTFSDKKILNIILIFSSTIFLFSIFDQTKSHKNIKDYNLANIKSYDETDVVMIFDEMSGLNSFESQINNGKKFDIEVKKFFKEYNFEFYSDIKSISSNSVTSISSLLNFTDNIIRSDVTSNSKNYFYEYELNRNLLFKNFKNISVYQNIHIDYCVVKNISKCRTYNPFNQKVFLDGFKNTYFTKIISLWKLNGSIVSALAWRSFRQMGIIDSILEPEGHKTSFNDLFSNIEKDVNSKKYDLIFVHTLVPHKPYGFDKNCKYDGKLSLKNNFYSEADHVAQHNLERLCVLEFLNKFLKKLNENNNLDSLNLTLLSDHGARIKRGNENSYLSTIFAHKNRITKFKEFKKKTTSQKVFSEIYN